MEQLVAELKKILSFKETTEAGDIVLVVGKNPQILLYAMVGDIKRDETRREEWWHVTLHLLSIPMQTVIWTLRTVQFTGQEIFTMGGEERFIKALYFEGLSPGPSLGSGRKDKGREGGQNPGLRIVK
jgi:hypothetical protein